MPYAALSALEMIWTSGSRAVGQGYYIERFQRFQNPNPLVIGLEVMIGLNKNRVLNAARGYRLSTAACGLSVNMCQREKVLMSSLRRET